MSTRRCFIAEWSCQSFFVCIIAANKHLSIRLKHILIRQQWQYVMREYVMVSPGNDTCILCLLILSWRTSMAISFEFLNRLEACSTGTCSNTNTWAWYALKTLMFFLSPIHKETQTSPLLGWTYRNHRPAVRNIFVPNNIQKLPSHSFILF